MSRDASPSEDRGADAGPADRLRLVELIAALSLATDLGLGQPMAHALRTCLLAIGLGRALGLSERELSDTYYTTLLRFVGCTSDSHDLLELTAGEDLKFRQPMVAISGDTPDEMAPHIVRFMAEAGLGGDIPALARETLESPDGLGARLAAVHCEVATMLAGRLGLGGSVCAALGRAFERRDGRGFPNGHAREAVPMPVRVAVVAGDVEVLTRTPLVGDRREVLRRRRDRAYDPRVVDAFLEHESAVLAAAESADAWREVLRQEPGGCAPCTAATPTARSARSRSGC